MTEQPHCSISIQKLHRSYTTLHNQQVQLLQDINLDIQAGAFVSLIGHAGCGKSTLLRLLMGLEQHQQGKILIQGKAHQDNAQSLSIVYPDHRLFAWLSVTENIRMALHQTFMSKEEENQRIQEQLDLLHLTAFKDAYPSQLSAGMNIKVAIAKSLVNQPNILLLDEPFQGLDAVMRQHLRDELHRIWQEKNMTIILVTEDIPEAIQLSTSIVVMQDNPGRIQQIFQLPFTYPRKSEEQRIQQLKKDIQQLLNPKDDSKKLSLKGQFTW